MEGSRKRIFAALDGGGATRSVIERAARMADEEGAALLLGHVVDMLPADANGANHDALCAWVHRRLSEEFADVIAWAKGLEHIESVKIHVAAGPVRRTLALRLIEPWHPDAVVCGASKEYGPGAAGKFRRTVRPSMETYLAHNLNCPVLVIR